VTNKGIRLVDGIFTAIDIPGSPIPWWPTGRMTVK
jgi:hypothetical protein